MMLSELLVPAAVSVRLRAVSKREVIAELVELLEAGHGVRSQGEILDRVLRREAMMSTGIGNGVAIPHGKARSVDRMLRACGVAPAGIDFEAVDGEPAKLFILPRLAGERRGRARARAGQHFRLLKEESVAPSDRGIALHRRPARRPAGRRNEVPHPGDLTRPRGPLVHFLDAWRELSPVDLVRLLAPAALLVLATVLPGARVVRAAAIGVALFLPGLRELAGTGLQVAAGWRCGCSSRGGQPANARASSSRSRPRAACRDGTVSLALGALLMLLLIVAVGRQDLSPEDARRASWACCCSVSACSISCCAPRAARRARVRRDGARAAGAGRRGARRAGAGRSHAGQRRAGGDVARGAGGACASRRRAKRHAGSPWVHDAHDLHD